MTLAERKAMQLDTVKTGSMFKVSKTSSPDVKTHILASVPAFTKERSCCLVQ